MARLESYDAGRRGKFANDPEEQKRPCGATVKVGVGVGAGMGSSETAHDGGIPSASKDRVTVLMDGPGLL